MHSFFFKKKSQKYDFSIKIWQKWECDNFSRQTCLIYVIKKIRKFDFLGLLRKKLGKISLNWPLMVLKRTKNQNTKSGCTGIFMCQFLGQFDHRMTGKPANQLKSDFPLFWQPLGVSHFGDFEPRISHWIFLMKKDWYWGKSHLGWSCSWPCCRPFSWQHQNFRFAPFLLFIHHKLKKSKISNHLSLLAVLRCVCLLCVLSEYTNKVNIIVMMRIMFLTWYINFSKMKQVW